MSFKMQVVQEAESGQLSTRGGQKMYGILFPGPQPAVVSDIRLHPVGNIEHLFAYIGFEM